MQPSTARCSSSRPNSCWWAPSTARPRSRQYPAAGQSGPAAQHGAGRWEGHRFPAPVRTAIRATMSTTTRIPTSRGQLQQSPADRGIRRRCFLSAVGEVGPSRLQRPWASGRAVGPAGPVSLQRRAEVAAQQGVVADRCLQVLDGLQLPVAAAEPGHRGTLGIQQRPGGHPRNPSDEAAKHRLPTDRDHQLRIPAGYLIPDHYPGRLLRRAAHGTADPTSIAG